MGMSLDEYYELRGKYARLCNEAEEPEDQQCSKQVLEFLEQLHELCIQRRVGAVIQDDEVCGSTLVSLIQHYGQTDRMMEIVHLLSGGTMSATFDKKCMRLVAA